MAIIAGGMNFTGGMGDFCAYRLPGSDKIVLRRKSGPGRQRIKQDKAYAITRLYSEEWKACTAATASLIRSMFPVKHLSDYPYAGALNGLFRFIQNEDPAAPLGKRGVLISQHPQRLEGFSLNRKQNFESYIKHPLQFGIERSNASATVQLPELVPGINLSNPAGHPLYRLVIVLGAVPDIVYNEERKAFLPVVGEEVFPVVAATGWQPAKQRMPATELSAAVVSPADISGYTLVLSIGLEFGLPLTNTEVRPVKRYGAAKILKMG